MLATQGGRAASPARAQRRTPGQPSTEPSATEAGPDPCSAGPSHVRVVSESPLLGTHCTPSSQRPAAVSQPSEGHLPPGPRWSVSPTPRVAPSLTYKRGAGSGTLALGAAITRACSPTSGPVL